MTPLYSSPKWHRGNVVGVGFFLFCYWHPDQRLPTQRLKLLHTNTQGCRCGHYGVILHISTGKWSKNIWPQVECSYANFPARCN